MDEKAKTTALARRWKGDWFISGTIEIEKKKDQIKTSYFVPEHRTEIQRTGRFNRGVPENQTVHIIRARYRPRSKYARNADQPKTLEEAG